MDGGRCFRLEDYTGDILALGFLLLLYSVSLLAAVGVEKVSITGKNLWDPLIALAVTIPLHEALHALTPLVSGTGVKAGFSRVGRMPVFYVGMKKPIPRDKYLVVALLPLISGHVFPILLLLGAPVPLVFVFTFVYNTVGSAGDILMFLSALRLGRGEEVWDTGTGFEGCLPKPYGEKTSLFIRFTAAMLFAIILVLIVGRIRIVVIRETP